METDSHSFQFKPKASNPRYSLVLLFDIEGFSRFFSQPDVEVYVPRFLNLAFKFVSLAINGGPAPWFDGPDNWPTTRAPWKMGTTEWPALPSPVHSKFLGDGALYIWEIGRETHCLKPHQIQDLFFRISVLRKVFPSLIPRWADEIPLANLPLNIRFGLAAGTVYRLNYAYNMRSEYMGYAINLASRLQRYCPEMGFISSARVEMPQEMLKKIGFIKVVARRIKGFPREIVIVRQSTFDSLTAERKQDLFILPNDEDAPSAPEFGMLRDITS